MVSIVIYYMVTSQVVQDFFHQQYSYFSLGFGWGQNEVTIPYMNRCTDLESRSSEDVRSFGSPKCPKGQSMGLYNHPPKIHGWNGETWRCRATSEHLQTLPIGKKKWGSNSPTIFMWQQNMSQNDSGVFHISFFLNRLKWNLPCETSLEGPDGV